MGFRKFSAVAVCVALALGSSVIQAKTFKWTSASDIPTWDIHSQNNAHANNVHAAVYESLVSYNNKTFKPQPVLAASWKQLTPTQMRFTLRTGVKFHDGSPFTADDAVYSIERAMSKTSNYTVYANSIEKVVKIDASTIDIITKEPNPVLLNQLTELRMMSKAWAAKNNSLMPKDIKTNEDSYAHRNAMGTGPFMLKEWQPDQKMVLTKNPNWWGKWEGNVTEIVYTPVKNVSTRMAALLSGEVDFVIDPSPQDLPRVRSNADLKVLDGIENRTIFFGMDQFRDELPGSNIKGKNPLKDMRVRKALYQAIDMDTIVRVTLRGQGQATGTLIAPQVNGWTQEIHKRLPYDVNAAKKLLDEAGYKDGFEVPFSCPNNRYINDEQICQAVTSMWAKIGVKAKLRTEPLATYFPMIQRYEASIYMLGWGVPPFDAFYSLQSLVRTVGAGGDGNYNVGRYSNPQIDALIERVRKETDLDLRTKLMSKALAMAAEDVAYLPLHNQIIPWAMKKNVEVTHRADNRLDWYQVKVK